MFIFTISSLGSRYLAQNSSSKIESSNDFEHSSPMLSLIGFPVLPTLRCHITGPIEVWQLMPTRARDCSPCSRASRAASVLAEYV
jgi:hypothetical protein